MERRLDKVLGNLGIASRSEVKKIVKAGLVSVNGIIVNKSDMKIKDEDVVRFKDNILNTSEFVYYLLNKPAGCVCAREDNLSETVFKYIKDKRLNLSPVGRLDKDTEGLLIITDDGKLNHFLMSPSHHVSKIYEAVIDRPVETNLIEEFAKGVDIGDDDLTKPARLEILSNTLEECRIRLEISEGRYHQVKRMFEAFDRKVIYLKRIQIGNLKLDNSLKPGEYRSLSDDEVENLKQCVK